MNNKRYLLSIDKPCEKEWTSMSQFYLACFIDWSLLQYLILCLGTPSLVDFLLHHPDCYSLESKNLFQY